jgi:hypothetical protein
MRGWFDVYEYGAAGDGTTPDDAAIQDAVNEAASKGGGIVRLPPGTYLLRAGVTIPSQVQVVGAGWPPFWVSGEQNPGTWLRVDSPGFSAITVTGAGVSIKDLAFVYNQSTPISAWKPNEYPHAIHVHSSDVLLENIHLFNPTRGIRVSQPDGVIGSVSLNRIWGQPILEGIYVDNDRHLIETNNDFARDVIKTSNVHFWPFWCQSMSTPAEGEPVNTFQATYGVAIRSGRNDNLHFSNVFVAGYSRGFLFDRKGIKSNSMIVNADLDYCTIGIEV